MFGVDKVAPPHTWPSPGTLTPGIRKDSRFHLPIIQFRALLKAALSPSKSPRVARPTRPGSPATQPSHAEPLSTIQSKTVRASSPTLRQDPENVNHHTFTPNESTSVSRFQRSATQFATWPAASFMPPQAARHRSWNHVVFVAISTIVATRPTTARTIHVIGEVHSARFSTICTAAHAFRATMIVPITPARTPSPVANGPTQPELRLSQPKVASM